MRGQLIMIDAGRGVVPLVLLGAVLSGCASGETGGASPAVTTTTVDAGTGSAVKSTTKQSIGSSLVDLKPCPVLASIGEQFGLTEIEEDGTESCNAVYSDSVSVRLDVHADKGLADYVPGPDAEITETNIGSRDAKLVKKSASTTACAVAVEVSASSRVDIAASADTSLDEACDAATKVAAAVGPKLAK
ncbi:hypothetical protein JOF41_005799 [Saccharothrix coeruleofusca]|uniref:hypothetical protein n=1 Tax=Saccharothrix coeruleofusca TaxID=33919 RepID=UPI001AE84670|nr:hypothetical protein [Saccharothrix coeruleofusca]MBP2339621.1 hypothetical protein [Saccharothrix coeruleofusca]